MMFLQKYETQTIVTAFAKKYEMLKELGTIIKTKTREFSDYKTHLAYSESSAREYDIPVKTCTFSEFQEIFYNSEREWCTVEEHENLLVTLPKAEELTLQQKFSLIEGIIDGDSFIINRISYKFIKLKDYRLAKKFILTEQINLDSSHIFRDVSDLKTRGIDRIFEDNWGIRCFHSDHIEIVNSEKARKYSTIITDRDKDEIF